MGGSHDSCHETAGRSGGFGYVLPVNGEVVDRSDERYVRAARRFGAAGLIYTVLFMFSPFATIIPFGWPPPEYIAPVLALYVIAFGLHVWRIREHVRSIGTRAAPWFMVAAALVGLALAVVGVASSPMGFVWAFVSGVLLGDIVAAQPMRWVLTWVACSTVVVLAAGYAICAIVYADISAFSPWFPSGFAAFFVATIWLVDVERLWWLKAVTALDDSRRTAAELATARERLRLADDLHDILGHALEVVAFKSELASRLLAADPDRARAEMEEVQQVARQSLTDVRAMVRDTRGTDLVTELAGARAVLDSAGVELAVHGDPAALGPLSGNVLGRVLREAMTNVLRHSQPSHCSIAIEVAGGGARLRVVNDGAEPHDGLDPGTGLVALGRYLDEQGGRLVARPGTGGTFELTAELPVAAR